MRRMTMVLGVPVDEVTLADAVDRVDGFVAEGRGLRQVATANTDFVVRAWSDPELMDVLRAADLVTADGMPLVWASRLLGGGLRERVAGADLVPALAERCAQRGYSIYLLGAAPDVGEEAERRLQERFPALRIAGRHSPPVAALDDMDHPGILRRVNAARPDVLLVAFGNPKQEKWIHRFRERLETCVAVGVGGTLDFIAGRTRRAPAWMQRSGAEWAWRLGNEPGRLWRRYLGDFARFGPRLAYRHFCAPALWSESGECGGAVEERDGVLVVRGRLTGSDAAVLDALGRWALERGRSIVLNLGACVSVDAAALGALVSLARRARQAGSDVRLVHVPGPIRRLLRLEKMESCVTVEVSS